MLAILALPFAVAALIRASHLIKYKDQTLNLWYQVFKPRWMPVCSFCLAFWYSLVFFTLSPFFTPLLYITFSLAAAELYCLYANRIQR